MLLSATKNINGPYMHDLQSHKSVYLAPKNMFMLHKIKKSSDFVNYYIDFLSPYPDSDNGSCILMGTYDIYKLDINSLDAKFLFSQSDKARKSHYLIRSTAMPFYNEDVIFFKNNERFGSFVILKNKGGQIEVPLIMDPFLKNYQ